MLRFRKNCARKEAGRDLQDDPVGGHIIGGSSVSPDRGDDRHLENIGVHSLEATHEGGNEKQNNNNEVEEEKLEPKGN